MEGRERGSEIVSRLYKSVAQGGAWSHGPAEFMIWAKTKSWMLRLSHPDAQYMFFVLSLTLHQEQTYMASDSENLRLSQTQKKIQCHLSVNLRTCKVLKRGVCWARKATWKKYPCPLCIRLSACSESSLVFCQTLMYSSHCSIFNKFYSGFKRLSSQENSGSE